MKVLVVDDSAVVRQALTALLSPEPDMEVVTAADPLIAMGKIKAGRPDVIVLDLEMPRMDGVTFLRQLMSTDPIPVVICSGLSGKGTAAVKAVEEGAVAIVTKPKLGVRDFLHESAVMLIDTIRGAAKAKVKRRRAAAPPLAPQPKLSADAVLPRQKPGSPEPTAKVVAVGASTGGTEALRGILESLPEHAPGIVVVQHMPEGFTRAFADRLNQTCRVEVKEAANGDRVVDGRALIAPGNRHTLVRRSRGHYVIEVADGPLVSRHRPSVDVLFRSVAQAAGPNAVGVILTGMGDDGAEGLLEMKRAGASTLAQDEASCVVFGMPKEAIARGGVDEVVSLSLIGATVLRKAAGLKPRQAT